MNPGLDTILQAWAACGWIRPLDLAFAQFVQREAPQADPLVGLGAALASHQLARGHACLDLRAVLADPDIALGISGPPAASGQPTPAQLLAGVSLRGWQEALRCDGLVQAGAGNSPLVLDAHRLYLRRYWQYECEVRTRMTHMMQHSSVIRGGVDHAALAAWLDRLFGPVRIGERPDWQRMACALAAGNAFTVITGGPGTGKTTTVVRLLAVLQALALGAQAQARAPVIRLAAPTGKAAARLSASIQRALKDLPLEGAGTPDQVQAIREAIPTTAVTLHRLLGARPGTRRLRHDASNPLPLDVLVVDEVSMVDLEMMAATLAALRPGARLVLLGDKDQLASVEAGTVLGELCRRAAGGHYTTPTVDWLRRTAGLAPDARLQDERGTPLDQSVAMLRFSHRFDADSGIGRLADAVHLGDVQAAQRTLEEGRADLAELDVESPAAAAWRHAVVHGLCAPAPADGSGPVDGYAHYLHILHATRPAAGVAGAPDAADPPAPVDAWARRVLQAMGRFQVLCAVREGPWGVEGLNAQIAEDLRRAGCIDRTAGWYAGRPVLVTRNDYGLGLMNGDIGVTLPVPRVASPDDPDASLRESDLRVAFDDGQGGIRWVAPSRLAAVETVFALTVHKSQGSEYDHVMLVLPETRGPILTRELLYTGITRARQRITLAGRAVREVARRAMERPVVRASGLVPQEAAPVTPDRPAF